ncbi:CLUMA_CG009430, isoform A [Clunio marinus]|uniref:CLUMA_CG009430, isoform A n=1 Tax=Clunio marinus TaxID=568069 RepID=A0A1J1I6S1_9DIPT|nr:CLUMA_CG009430, isoform A [Clunio marinus]
MSFSKIVLTIIASLVLFKFILSEKGQHFYYRYLTCNVSDEFVYPNYTCYAKSFNRSFSAESVSLTLRKPLYQVFIDCKMMYKYGTIYREIMRFDNIDFCKIMEEGSKNKLVQAHYGLFNESVPGVLHKCPYTSIDISNQAIDANKVPSIFPSGEYKNIFGYDTKDRKMIVESTSVLTITSSIKDSFGK